MLQDLNEAFRLTSETNNQAIKAGEAIITKLRSNINYPNLLFTCLKESTIDSQKLRASIELRIWCESYKNMEEFERNVYQGEIENIKINILFAFLEYNHTIEKTLLPGIVSLTAVEFPDKWSALIPGLITYAKQNPNSILKILELMVEITNKYSYLTRSDPLYHEIIIVCNEFHKFLLTLTSHSVTNILQNQSNSDQIKILEQELILFYNLNYQDLHPEFEDNLKTWMDILKKVMNLPNNNENFFKCKGAALQSILLYASKYKDDVEESIRGFCHEIWELCANASLDPENDDVVFNALKYFRSLIVWSDMKEFFAGNIPSLISNLIIKNLALNDNYKDLFNEEIETFISYFFKNCELNSRRSASIELLNGIVRNYNNFEQYLESQITAFRITDQNAEDQATLLTLVIESAARGFRDVDGVTMLQIKQDIIKYCYENFIRNTLQLIFQKTSENQNKPIEEQINLILLIATLRYIFYFRIYLPTDELNTVLKLCCSINTNSESIRQILIFVVSSIVTLKHGNFVQYKNIVNYYDEQKISDVAAVIFGMISNYDQKSNALNASLNRLFFSTVKLLKSSNEKFYDSHLAGITKSMLMKTGTFDFGSILPLFEALGYLTYYLCSMKSNKCRDLENITEQFFHQNIKSQSDILNFSFQILSIFLQYHPGNTDFYLQLYNSTIRTENWIEDNISIMSSYLQYITAFIALDNQRVVNDKVSYETILTKLIELDHYELFYRFLKRILKLTDIKGFCQYGYMNVLVQGTKFVSSRSLEGRKIGLLFLFEITNEYNTSEVVNLMNQIEQGFYENTLIKNADIIQTLQVLRHRKLMFGSICNALASGYILKEFRCFHSTESQAKMINMLVENLSGKFKRDHLGEQNGGDAARKETTYQKLQVFKEIENINTAISLDEEYVLIEAYTLVAKNNPDVSKYLENKNLERLKKIYDRQNNQRQNQ